MHVETVVQVDAGQYGENERLQERDQKFKTCERDHQAKWCPSAKNTKANNKTTEDLQQHVASHHVREQTNRVADGANEERDQFENHDDWQKSDWNA